MISLEVLITFTIAALILNLSPGPSNLYVMARSISQGVRGGVVSVIGLSVGGMIHVVAAVLGLSTIFEHSPTFYVAVKMIGAAYLIYLGWNYIKSSSSGEVSHPIPKVEKSLATIFRESVLVEVTNPKTALFFVALLPQFVNPEVGSVSQQLLLLGVIVVVSALPCDLLIAVFAGKASKFFVGE